MHVKHSRAELSEPHFDKARREAQLPIAGLAQLCNATRKCATCCVLKHDVQHEGATPWVGQIHRLQVHNMGVVESGVVFNFIQKAELRVSLMERHLHLLHNKLLPTLCAGQKNLAKRSFSQKLAHLQVLLFQESVPIRSLLHTLHHGFQS
jgi:hypothetical protein